MKIVISDKICSFCRLVGREIYLDRWIYAIIAGHALLSTMLLSASGMFNVGALVHHMQTWLRIYVLLIPGVFIVSCAVTNVIVNRQLPHTALMAVLRRRRAGRLLAGICLSVAIGVFMCFYTLFKTAMPIWHGGFPHDYLLSQVDKTIHFGINPTNFLASWFSDPSILMPVDFIYSRIWMIVVFAGLFAVASTRGLRKIRFSLFTLFLLAWILGGNILAYLGLSAGPVFFEKVTGDGYHYNALAEMISETRANGISAFIYYQYLWDAFSRGTVGIGTGISAFPSMHVASAAVIACFMSEFGRVTTILGTAFVAVILYGSVQLGWHYAIDGYYSIALVVLFYRVMRKKREFRFAAPEPVCRPATVISRKLAA